MANGVRSTRARWPGASSRGPREAPLSAGKTSARVEPLRNLRRDIHRSGNRHGVSGCRTGCTDHVPARTEVAKAVLAPVVGKLLAHLAQRRAPVGPTGPHQHDSGAHHRLATFIPHGAFDAAAGQQAENNGFVIFAAPQPDGLDITGIGQFGVLHGAGARHFGRERMYSPAGRTAKRNRPWASELTGSPTGFQLSVCRESSRFGRGRPLTPSTMVPLSEKRFSPGAVCAARDQTHPAISAAIAARLIILMLRRRRKCGGSRPPLPIRAELIRERQGLALADVLDEVEHDRVAVAPHGGLHELERPLVGQQRHPFHGKNR